MTWRHKLWHNHKTGGYCDMQQARPSKEKPHIYLRINENIFLRLKRPIRRVATALACMTKQTRKQQGFTLIELLFVILIIGALSSFIVPNYSKVETKAKEYNLKASVRAIQIALESYYLTQGRYPKTSDIDSLLSTLKSSGDMPKTPINPFTKAIFSHKDASGKITYSFDDSSQAYTIQLLGHQNKASIAVLSNKDSSP